jgi:hypothetical protein
VCIVACEVGFKNDPCVEFVTSQNNFKKSLLVEEKSFQANNSLIHGSILIVVLQCNSELLDFNFFFRERDSQNTLIISFSMFFVYLHKS